MTADQVGPPDPGLRSAGWFTVTVECDESAAELVADILWQGDPPAVEERRSPQPGRVVLLAGYPDEQGANAAAAASNATGTASAEVTPVDDDGLDGWRAHARVEHAAPFVLVPAWLDHEPAPGEVVVRIDPGPTFGSGSHPTTRLVLEVAAALVGPGTRVLDVGCGSGVLAVAAALLGATAVGIDVDPAAAEITWANARANGVADRVRFDHRPLASLAVDARAGGDRFDVVLANLLSPIVVDLSSDLIGVVAPGGHVVVSGLLSDRIGPAADSLTVDGGLEPVGRLDAEGWVALTFRRPSS